MFTVIFHDEAEKSLRLCLRHSCKNGGATHEAGSKPLASYASQIPNPLGNGLFEIRTMGADIARGIWVYQVSERIFSPSDLYQSPKTPPAK